MSKPVRVIPLGGIGEIGKNITVFEQGDELIVLDCGISFPREEGMFGADIVVPDFAYLIANQHKIKAVVITHGHEDHIGGLSYLMRQVKVPEVWATRFTLGLIKAKIDEAGLIGATTFKEIEPESDSINVGPFELEFFRVSHSVPDCVGVAIHTDHGTILHTGDIKLDPSPIDGVRTDLAHIAEIGGEGVALFMGDSTNADVPGHTRSERSLSGPLRDIAARAAKGRIIACCFSSHIHRIQQFADIAQEQGRALCILGRSMTRNTNIAKNLGYMDIDGLRIIKPQALADMDPSEVMVVCAGSQGEPLAAMNRYAMGTHPQLHVEDDDTVIFSSRTIPGNDTRVHRVINQLSKHGAHILHADIAQVHVSGHGASQELMTVLQLVRPTCFMPVHGEWRHLRAHADLARAVGVASDNILFSENGSVVVLKNGVAKVSDEKVENGQRLVDRHSNEDILARVMEDRQQVSGDGLLVVVAHRGSGDLEVISRGFMDTDADLLDDARDAAIGALEADNAHHLDLEDLSDHVRDAVIDVVHDRSRKSPLVVPVIL